MATAERQPTRDGILEWLWPPLLVVAALAVSAALLQLSGVVDLGAAMGRAAARLPVLGPIVATYERGLPNSQRLKREEAELASQRAQLAQLRAQLAQQQAAAAAQQNALAQQAAALQAQLAALKAEPASSPQALSRVGALFSQMDPGAAAAILTHLDDATVAALLSHMEVRAASDLLARLDPPRAAQIAARMAAGGSDGGGGQSPRG